jgi:hypothetical protein
LTSHACIKAIEVSEKQHGCDLKTTFANLIFLTFSNNSDYKTLNTIEMNSTRKTQTCLVAHMLMYLSTTVLICEIFLSTACRKKLSNFSLFSVVPSKEKSKVIMQHPKV